MRGRLKVGQTLAAVREEKSTRKIVYCYRYFTSGVTLPNLHTHVVRLGLLPPPFCRGGNRRRVVKQLT